MVHRPEPELPHGAHRRSGVLRPGDGAVRLGRDELRHELVNPARARDSLTEKVSSIALLTDSFFGHSPYCLASSIRSLTAELKLAGAVLAELHAYHHRNHVGHHAGDEVLVGLAGQRVRVQPHLRRHVDAPVVRAACLVGIYGLLVHRKRQVLREVPRTADGRAPSAARKSAPAWALVRVPRAAQP